MELPRRSSRPNYASILPARPFAWGASSGANSGGASSDTTAGSNPSQVSCNVSTGGRQQQVSALRKQFDGAKSALGGLKLPGRGIGR